MSCIYHCRDELKSGYADPPARFTMIGSVGGKEAAITIEASGYGGSPVVVERSKIHKLKKRVAVGARVFTSDMVDLGTVSRYDPATGWMMIDNGGPFGGPNLLLPVTIVEDVDTDSQYVYLVFSQADLERRQHLEPANVILSRPWHFDSHWVGLLSGTNSGLVFIGLLFL